MRDVMAVEWCKLRRSPVSLWAAVVALVLMPVLGIAFVRLAATDVVGPLAAKLEGMVIGSGWEAYIGVLGQLVAVGQFLAVGFITVWCFGREFSDQTIGALFALPVSRQRVAAAKFGVTAAWAFGVSALMVVVVTVIGLGTGLEGSSADILSGLARLFTLAVLSSLLAAPLALIASVGRGYLPGLGALIAIVAVSQIAVLFGAGAWFPFAAPGLWAVSWQAPDLAVGLVQLMLVPGAAMVGAGLTLAWWARFELA